MSTDNAIERIQAMKAVVAAIGMLLILAGIAMVAWDIRDEAGLSLKTPIIEAEISGTLAGVMVIFLGFCLDLVLNQAKPSR